MSRHFISLGIASTRTRQNQTRGDRGCRKRPSLLPALECLERRALLSGVPASWSSRGAGGGGALYSPQINPSNPSEEFISSDMGELFHSTNGGASWQDIDFHQIQGNLETKVDYTEVPGLFYSLDYSNDSTVPTESTDGGITWHPLANDPTGGGAFKLFVDPANHAHVILSDYTNLYSSLDGGTTWGTRYTTPNSDNGLNLAGAFFDGNNIDVGTSDGLLVSSNGGATFTLSSVGGIASGQAMLSFAGSKQGSTTRLIVITRAAGDVYAGIQGYDYQYPDSVYTLTVGQPSWALSMSGIGATSYENYVAMSSGDINDVYIAGGNQAGAPTVYKTTNGGQSWSSVFLTTNNQNIETGWSGQGGDRGWGYGEVALGLTVSATDPNHIIFTDEGFAHESTDAGATWHALYVAPSDLNPAGAATPTGKSYHDSGLDNTSIWGLDWVDSTHMIVSATDIEGELSSDGGQTFNFGFTGDTYNTNYRTVTEPSTGISYAAVSSIHDMYQSTHLTDASIDGGSGAVLYSSNEGTTWQILHNFGHPVVWVATDPNNPDRLYASVVNSSSGGIYVTNDLHDGASSVWTHLTNPPRTQGHPFNIQVLNDGTLVATYSGRRAGSPQMFTPSSGVFVSTDGGATWTDRSAPGLMYWTTDLIVDPGDATQSTWYAGAYNGYGGAGNNLGGLYKTTNRGQSWTLIQAFDGVTSATFNPTNPNEMFVTTEDQGLWYSSNAQAAVPTLTQVSSYPFFQPERVYFNPSNANEIWITSFGSGMMVGETGSAGAVAFGNGTYSVREDAGTESITVTRTGGTTGAIAVHYATSDGTAKAGTDYSATQGVLNFADGQTSASFSIPILTSTKGGAGLTVNLALSSPSGGATLGNTATAVLTITHQARAADDYDGDGSTDPTVFRLATSQWFIDRSTGGLLTPEPVFGAANLADIPVMGDFDDVGHAELAVYRPSTGQWFVMGPTGGRLLGTFGGPTDIPVPGDYDGIGHDELAVYRPSTAQWFVLGPSGGRLLGTFGAKNLQDIPVPGDYDGVGHTELAVFRPATSQWFVMGSSGGRLVGTFGAPNLQDIPVPGDYDGVGHDELAVFRPATAQWFVMGSSGGRLLTTLGAKNLVDVPVEAPIAALKALGRIGSGGGLHMAAVVSTPAPAPGASLTAWLPRVRPATLAHGKRPS